MTVKIRGNGSAYRDQKPYKIKLQKKADLLNRGDKKYADKNWALLAAVGWNEWFGLKVGQLVQRKWAPDGEWVNVIFNGSYHGLYILTETIERNETARIDVSDEGFVVEKDAYWWTENGEYILSYMHPSFNYTMKYPEFEDMDELQRNAIASEMDQLKEITENSGYEAYIDIDSFVDFVLVHDFLGTNDSGGCNMYYTKYDSNSKIGMGPAWDFDSCSGSEDFSGTHKREGNLTRLFQNSDRTFLKKYIDRFDEIKEDVNALMEKMIVEGPCSEEQLERNLEAAQKVVVHATYSHTQAKEKFGSWFDNHKVLLEEAVNKLRETSSVGNLAEDKIQFTASKGKVVVSGMPVGQQLSVYSIDGCVLDSQVADSTGIVECSLDNYQGIVVIRVADKSYKVVM